MFHRPNTPNQPGSPSTTTPQGNTQAMNQQTPTTPDAPDTSADASRSADIPATNNPFQRPGQPAAAAAPAARPAPAYSAYPAYGSTTPAMGASSMSAAGADTKRRLLIGEGITLSGEIESCDHLVVEGTVEAALKGANVLEIAEKGMFYGTVEINEATIAGKFEGEITVNGRLTVRGTGSVTGSISYKELAVEAGAMIDGKLTPVGSKGSSSEKKSHKGSNAAPAGQQAAKQDDLPILRAAGQ